MKNQFNLLREEIQKQNNPAMNLIVELLEEYNNGLSHYFKDREITRDFMDLFDLRLTANAFNERFGVDVMKGNMSMQQLLIDLNTLARSTWYFEREDGKILTGQTLYENKAVYMASIKVKKPIYENKEAEELLEAHEDHTLHYPDLVDIPEPIGFETINQELPGEENISTIEEMVTLIKMHAMFNEIILLGYLDKVK